ncbi:unnamed protein product [Owenia fusiformis]|uniref:Uncharacterized protein n=1 Tax=Owenia fusiformis TaxID=6347 RepID=A0A8J1U6X4_OWEFU|nr:unnamed protein product [Owenia fusiformis]
MTKKPYAMLTYYSLGVTFGFQKHLDEGCFKKNIQMDTHMTTMFNKVILLFFITYAITVLNNKNVYGSECNEPQNLSRVLQRARRNSDYSENVAMLPPLTRILHAHWANRSRTYLETKGEDHNGRHIFGDTECKINTTSRFIMKRSICPWSYVYNYDKNRFPSTMVQASCNCKDGCYGKEYGFGCRPVYYNVRVLRKQAGECGEDGFYKYIPDWERIAVGCTCVADKVSKIKGTVVG